MSITRRELLGLLGGLGLGSLAAHLGGCAIPGPAGDDGGGDQIPDPALPDGAQDTLRAAMDVMIPAAPDGIGAVEAGALEVLALERFVPLARGLGLLPALPPDWQDAVAGGADPLLQGLLAAELDAMAFEQRALTPFRYLSRAEQEEAIALAMLDPRRRAAMRFLRSACVWAYLGAVVNDLGLRAIGFPPFEDFADRLAVSGYPRTTATGEIDDYTDNRAPAPTAGDDLSLVLDARGDLL
jgi:hypothetical protein